MTRPLPLQALQPARWHDVAGVFTDIDDTLTRDGAIEPAALQALQALRSARVPVIAITGRPLGWSEPFARQWPVAAIVAENGAVALLPEPDRVLTEFTQDEATRSANAVRLHAVARRILQEVPAATLARDSAGRVTDIAVDHSEFSHLGSEAIGHVMRLMREAGMNATVSSIHINGWYGEHTKLTGARWMVRRLYGRDLDAEIDRWVFVGDSTNDQVMFAHFPASVGVANLMDFADRLQTWPSFLTEGPRGQGFAEVAEAVLRARSLAQAASAPGRPGREPG